MDRRLGATKLPATSTRTTLSRCLRRMPGFEALWLSYQKSFSETSWIEGDGPQDGLSLAKPIALPRDSRPLAKMAAVGRDIADGVTFLFSAPMMTCTVTIGARLNRP
jgi:hypothetical protein